MTSHRESSNRDFSGNQLGDNATIIQGDTHLHLPHRPARLPVRVIPYPRNEDLVSRPDLVARVNELLPRTTEAYSAALWGLGGSGKTQLALDYAYRRCKDRDCSVFWVHADNKASFSQDYKAIARKLGVDETLEDRTLFTAVRESIESQPLWALILDNADDLTLFGVGTAEETNSLLEYIPKSPTGTTLWTSRDEHIVGPLVGPGRGVRVGRMTLDEATKLLNMTRNNDQIDDVAETTSLLEELQCLPLAVSQAGAYVRRTSTSVNEYMSMLSKGKQRWETLKDTEFDRHRRPNAANSVLETWAISMNQIRQESKMAHEILHVMGYVDNRSITFELLRAASVHISETTARSRQGTTSRVMRCTSSCMRLESSKKTEAYFSGIAVQVIGELFPKPKRETWSECEKYVRHAVQVGEWAEVSGKKIETTKLLNRISEFLDSRGRWREREPVVVKLLHLQRELFGEKHPTPISTMVSLASTYRKQGRYDEAEPLQVRGLDLQRELLGEKHSDTIKSMHHVASVYREQGRYSEAEAMQVEALGLSREVLGNKHHRTIRSMALLSRTYVKQGRLNEAESIQVEVLNLQRELRGDHHRHTSDYAVSLSSTYFRQGRYNEAESLYVEALYLRLELVGWKHPRTLKIIHNLAHTWHKLGRFNDALSLMEQCVQLRSVIMGSNHPETKLSAEQLAWWRAEGSEGGGAQ
ncbi:P-loop containing nucleoside triphosphate hydrolase protein [Dactylonectria estremocensis]|uniref:P-loop containing nucleoside triphosphate hydrolase protein n=1 Tax=Dactylonectria estremocensis TaxID=1079267 RepID=A0A9P9FC31_9HYPO|nr:P-loop containing nucleoside triphosphate hydrolase protein [Dactylonectria estremocensis]